MILLTMIARVADGLPLAASIQEDEQVSMNASFHQKLLKTFGFVMNVNDFCRVTAISFVWFKKIYSGLAYLCFNDSSLTFLMDNYAEDLRYILDAYQRLHKLPY